MISETTIYRKIEFNLNTVNREVRWITNINYSFEIPNIFTIIHYLYLQKKHIYIYIIINLPHNKLNNRYIDNLAIDNGCH